MATVQEMIFVEKTVRYSQFFPKGSRGPNRAGLIGGREMGGNGARGFVMVSNEETG